MNTQQRQLISYTKKKVKELFRTYPSPGHELDHAVRVMKTAQDIAKTEQADLFLVSLCSLVHDIGRAIEKNNPGKTHHELSYRMLQEWFRDDHAYSVLSNKDKLLILYAVRYHWNDVADESKEAIILRDADKLDALGKIGVQRAITTSFGDEKKLHLYLRFCYHMVYWLRTKKARQLARQKKSIAFVDSYVKKLLKKIIPPVSL